MPNKNYVKGRRKEYKICKTYRERYKFDIVQRTAGSHSPVDIIAIDKIRKRIHFIQAKPDSMSENEKNKINKELDWLNDEFMVSFHVE